MDLPPKPSGTPGPSSIGLEAYFRITDQDTGGSATYRVSCGTLGISWGPDPFSGGRTLKAGPPRNFQVKRSWNLDEGGFGGPAWLIVYSTGGKIYFDMAMAATVAPRVKVAAIEMGETREFGLISALTKREMPGTDRYSGMVTMVKQ
jgi:hypothetical protein